MTVTVGSPSLERLKAILAEIADLEHTEHVLDWDSRVSMPPGGAEARAEASATLRRLHHERLVSDEIGELLDELAAVKEDTTAALIRLTRWEWDRARRIPSELAGEMAQW